MSATYRITNGTRILRPNADVSLEPGQIDIKDNHQIATALEIRFAAKVAATNAYGGGALNVAKKAALLKGIRCAFSYGGSDEKARTEPLQDVTLEELQRMQEQLLEKLLYGYADSTEGLDKVLVANTTNTVKWRSLVPFSCEMFEPTVYLGCGRSQLLTARLALSMGADALNAADNTLSVTEIAIETWAVLKQVNGDQISPVPHLRKKTEPGKLGMGFGDGLPLRLEDTNAPLASTAITQITVKVGDEVIVAPPATPRDIHDAFVESPDVGATELSDEYRTPLYEIPDMLIGKARTGPITVEMRTQDVEALKLAYVYLPVPNEENVLRDVRAAAMADPQKAGDVILATSAVELDGYACEARHRPFLPFRVFRQGETQFDMYPGLKCVYAGEPEVYIPDGFLERAAKFYLSSMLENAGQGNQGAMRDTVRSVAVQVPGTIISGRGFAGGRSAIYAEVERQILERVALLVQAARA
ncbi:MAG TPA: hypothetical protein VEU33_03525 [Archangium sp.]|nr:hypothetical protein [Archangium sp.]